ncbi:phytanoyl-CoA dioxygenase 1-like [Elysia marginata]|uniref:Phytanoyl-CoA dioxygenase 1-like n=1 Tax=Elysia marginata TaxID=1093978 RepID=A0AAV4F1P3_9GAST|nr:phytanoyl-CoA dioxygenase 1-like [Elysia marginata]
MIDQSFQRLWSNERVLNLMEQILGPEVAGHPVWNLRTKTPRSEAVNIPWHQDQPIDPSINHQTNKQINHQINQPTNHSETINQTSHTAYQKQEENSNNLKKKALEHIDQTYSQDNLTHMYTLLHRRLFRKYESGRRWDLHLKKT